MRPTFCTSCLASVFKFLNFLQAFVGVSLLVYSLLVFDRWKRHVHGIGDLSVGVPDPWFAYVMMGMGGLMLLFAFAGHVAAEAINRCCLCFYTLLATTMILLEAAVAGYLVLDKHWEEDLPKDPTGELQRLRTFIETNADIFKWASLSMVVIQALSLLLAIILRVMVSPSTDDDSDDDGDSAVTRKPLLKSQYSSNRV